MARTTKLLLTGPPCASAAGAERRLDLNIPQWFSSALAAPVQECTTTVAGCTISYRCWGPAGAAGIILVHGGAAHARWWDHIAPMLGPGYRVAALDLSGHGDSGRPRRHRAQHGRLRRAGHGAAPPAADQRRGRA